MNENLKSKTLEKIKLIFWGIFPVVLGASMVALVFLVFEKIDLNKTENTASVIQSFTAEKPAYFYANKKSNTQPKVSATAFLVGDLDTGEVILSNNPDKIFPIASTSKLMTALVSSLIMSKNDIAQVSKSALATAGTNGELKLGEKIKTSDLLYPLLLESSNDAAEVLAEHFTRTDFIAKMNQVAQTLKMSQTSYDDPSGLSQKNQSTVSDLFRLAGYLKKEKPEIIAITDKRSYSTKQHAWSNISQFLNDSGYIGGKSGFTNPAKQTVVSIFNLPLGKTGYRPIGITLLQSVDRHKDVETIVQYLKKNIYYGGLADANTDWVQNKLKMPEPKDPDFITFAFAGDIMLDRGVKNSVRKNFNNDYSKLFIKPGLSEILKQSDIIFGNLEGTASDKGTDLGNLYSFRMDPEVVPALKGAGVSVVSLANNHIGDWGRIAFSDTLSRLTENEILYTGGGNDKNEAETPAIIQKYGMKIGFLAFSDKGPDYMEAETDKAGILLANDPNFDEIIKNASKQVDYLVVSFHFGEEYQTKHNARQELLAHKAVDDGAKIVIGSHPHTIEDTEAYSRKGCTQSSCTSYIAYSLGNFIFDQSWSAPTMKGMLLEMKLNRDGSMTTTKDTIQLSSIFQPEITIKGKEEKVKF